MPYRTILVVEVSNVEKGTMCKGSIRKKDLQQFFFCLHKTHLCQAELCFSGFASIVHEVPASTKLSSSNDSTTNRMLRVV